MTFSTLSPDRGKGCGYAMLTGRKEKLHSLASVRGTGKKGRGGVRWPQKGSTVIRRDCVGW